MIYNGKCRIKPEHFNMEETTNGGKSYRIHGLMKGVLLGGIPSRAGDNDVYLIDYISIISLLL